MDFDSLRTILPKKTSEWRIPDVEKWLRFIHLEPYIVNFRALSIDGSILKKLSEEDLKGQLQINSRIILKKLSTWISKGLDQYDNYLTSVNVQQEQTSQQQFPQPLIKTQINQYEQAQSQFCKAQSIIKRQKEHCLILRRVESNVINYYYRFVETNCSIGRHTNCQVQVEDENVDVFHCKIMYRHPHFYLKDTSSKDNGTFLKITKKMAIRNNMLVQMGSHLFCFLLGNNNRLKVKIVLGDCSGQTFNFEVEKRKVVIGRKSTNDINIGGDSHLSNLHARLVYQQNQWFIEDLGTTNGTWVILENQLRITNGIIFKLGCSNYQFECQLKVNYTHEEETLAKNQIRNSIQLCYCCKKNQRQVLFIPCNHVVRCSQCSVSCSECEICRSSITEKVKIYKS